MRLLKAAFGLWVMIAGAGYLYFAFNFVQSLAEGKTDIHAALVWGVAGFPALLFGWLVVKWGWQFVTGLR